MIRTYLYGIVALLLAAAFVADGIYYYNKGKDSVFKGVLAGIATNQAKDDKETQAALAKAEELGSQLATLKAEKNELVRKLKASVAANPRSACVLSDDELQSLQDAARSTGS